MFKFNLKSTLVVATLVFSLIFSNLIYKQNLTANAGSLPLLSTFQHGFANGAPDDFNSNETNWKTQPNFAGASNAKLIAGPWAMSPNGQGTNNTASDFPMWLQKFSGTDKVPYLYLYLVAGQARIDSNLSDCNYQNAGPTTLCQEGANYVRSNEAKLNQVYIDTANNIKQYYGSDKPIMLHFEPDFYQYASNHNGSSQNGGNLSFAKSNSLLESWRASVKSILPNAVTVRDVSPWINPNNNSENGTLATWFGDANNFDYAGLVGKRYAPNGDGSSGSDGKVGIDGKSYAQISQMTGKKLILNDSAVAGGYNGPYDTGWENRSTVQARWDDGVVAVLLPPTNDSALFDTVNSYKTNPVPSGVTVSSSTSSLSNSSMTNSVFSSIITSSAVSSNFSSNAPSNSCALVTATKQQGGNDWYNMELKLTNNGPSLGGWEIIFDLPNNQTVQSNWNNTYTQTGRTVKVKTGAGVMPSQTVDVGGLTINNANPNTLPTNFTVTPNLCPNNSVSSSLLSSSAPNSAVSNPNSSLAPISSLVSSTISSANSVNSSSNICKPKLTIMPMGDSITEGAGDYLNDGNFYTSYRPILWKRLVNSTYPVEMVGTRNTLYQNAIITDSQYSGYDKDHESVSGITIEALELRIRENRVVSQNKPDLIPLMIGTNNANGTETAQQMATKWEALINFIILESPNSRILILKTPPKSSSTSINNTITSYNNLIKNKAIELANSGKKITWLENNVTIADLPDLVHPYNVGDTKIADSIFTYIATTPIYKIDSNYCFTPIQTNNPSSTIISSTASSQAISTRPSSLATSTVSSSNQITSACPAIYPSPCSNSSIPTCQEMGLSICNNSSAIGEGQTSQMSQAFSSSNSSKTSSEISSSYVNNSQIPCDCPYPETPIIYDLCQNLPTYWSSGFESDWENSFKVQNTGSFYANNRIVENKENKLALKVNFAQGSYGVNEAGVPIGGTGFRTKNFENGSNEACLSYKVFFEDGFNFNKGGKLPGFYGGTEATGGNIPNGTSGFSSRLMWRTNGDGEVYAYLPNSENFGTSLGRGNFRFETGKWQTVTQYVKLNDPSSSDGIIKLWHNNSLVYETNNQKMRTVDSLKIDGILAHTFFGGNDSSWASPKNQNLWLSDFNIQANPTTNSSTVSSQATSQAQNSATRSEPVVCGIQCNYPPVSSAESSAIASTNSSTNLMPILANATPITGTLGLTDMEIIRLNSNYSVVPNGVIATFEPKDSGVKIEGIIQDNNFVPKMGSVIPLTAKEGIYTGELVIPDYGRIIVNTNFSSTNPVSSTQYSSSLATSTVSSSNQITSACPAIYPSPCSNSSIPTCQEMALSICDSSSTTPIIEGQTSQMSQPSSASINQGTAPVEGQSSASSSSQNSSTTSSIALISSIYSIPSILSSSTSLSQTQAPVSTQNSSITKPVISSNTGSLVSSSSDTLSNSNSSAKSSSVSSSVISLNASINFAKDLIINNKKVTIALKNSDCKELSSLRNLEELGKQWVEFRASCGKTEIETIWQGFDTTKKYKLVKYNPITKTSKKWSANIKVVGNTIVTLHTIFDGQDGDYNNIKTEIWDPYTLEEEDSVSSILDTITPRSGGEIIYLPLLIVTLIGGVYVFSKQKKLS